MRYLHGKFYYPYRRGSIIRLIKSSLGSEDEDITCRLLKKYGPKK